MFAHLTERRWFHRTHAGLTLSCLCLFLLAGLTGCAEMNARTAASNAFDELAAQSLDDDMTYVREHVSPTYFGKTENEQVSNDVLQKLMTELRISRAISCQTTSTPDTMVLQVAKTKDGKVVYSYVHMKKCEEKGWTLVGKPAPAEPEPNTGKKE